MPAHLDPIVTKVVGWFDAKLETIETIAVRIDPADSRRVGGMHLKLADEIEKALGG